MIFPATLFTKPALEYEVLALALIRQSVLVSVLFYGLGTVDISGIVI